MVGVDVSALSPRDMSHSGYPSQSPGDDGMNGGAAGRNPLARLRKLRQTLAHRLTHNYKQRKRVAFLLLVSAELLYIFVSVPLRTGLYFDPFAADRSWSHGWTESLTVFTVLDVLCDVAGVVGFYDIFHARRRALAAIAANATNGLVASRRRHPPARGARRGNNNNNNAPGGGGGPGVSTMLQRVRSSLLVAWSLNTILPPGQESFDIRRPLALELLSAIPVELFSFAFGPNTLHVLRMLKLIRLYRVPSCVRELKQIYARTRLVQVMEYTANALLIRTVVSGLAMAHWLACIYLLIANVECGIDYQRCAKGVAVAARIANSDHTSHAVARALSGGPPPSASSNAPPPNMDSWTCWAIEDQLVGATRSRKYARAIYWGCRSVITLGYYDVAAVTNTETIFVIIVQIIGAIFSTRVIATCLFIFRYRGFRQQEFMAHVDDAKAYMKMRKFPDDVREGVLSYYKHVWATHRGLYQGKVIERLPEHLRVSVMGVLRVQRIQNVSFLAKESVEFVNTLALRLELSAFSPKDWIIEKVADGMYFVLRGKVILDGGSSGNGQPRFLKPGDHFAEASVLYPGKSDDRARAQTFCELYKLPQVAFVSALRIFYREHATSHLERMQSMHTRRDQQEQKMKRMLGRSAEPQNSSSAALFGTGGSGGGSTSTSKKKKRFYEEDWRLPGSTLRKWWEHGRMVSLVFVAYEVPFFIVFDSATFPFGAVPKYNIQSLTSVVVELFFVLDFVFRARYFAYIDALAMIPVTDPTYILEAYKAQGGLWVDLLSILPVPIITEFARSSDTLTYEPFFRLVRLVRLRYLFQVIQDLAHIRNMSSKVQTTLTLLLCVTFVLHVSGCLWFLMARFSYKPDVFTPITSPITRDACLEMASRFNNCSWAILDAYGQIGTKFVVQDATSKYTSKFAYLRSIYWSIVALTTVGYGDIVAFSTYESFFAAFWVFFGAIINYGVVGAMSNVIANLTANSHHHLERMNHINLVLAHFEISEATRQHIRRFYHSQFYVQNVTSEANLLAHLPQQLRNSISLILHSDAVKQVALFIEMGNERLLNDLTGLFRRRLYQRGDSFFPENNLCDEMYVIVRGRVNIFTKRVMPPTIPVGALSDGDCYGICELLLQKNFVTTLVAVTIVEASVISQTAFLTTIERRYPTEVQTLRLRALQDDILDRLRLEAIIENIRTRSTTLAKYTEDCTSMFTEKDDSVHYAKKMQLRFVWDLLLFSINLFNAFAITFRIGFLHAPSDRTRWLLVLLDGVGDVVLAADIYLQLFFFECEAGFANLRTRSERDEHYMHARFRKDVLASLPLYYVGSDFFAMSLCRLPRLLRARSVLGLMDTLIVRIQQRFASGNIAAYLSPLKPILILLFAAHFAACGFYLISETDHNVNTWIHHDHVVHQEHESTGSLYLRAFYWALTTLTLVGSREITPLGIPGTLWATATCMCCTFVFGHIVDELSELVLELDKAKKELKEREASFEQFAKDHELLLSIRTRVLHYLKFQHSYLKGKDIYETFEDLPPNLKVQLMLDLHGDTINNLCIAPFLNQTQINGLAVRLKSELVIPGDTIIVEGDLGNKLYIVKYGTAMVVWKATGTAVATLNTGSLFGEVAFFLRGQRRIASVQATACSELLILDRKSWVDLMNASPPDEADATERALAKWVRACLKGYNIMTVEIVKDIKVGGEAPMTIEQMREVSARRAGSSSRLSGFGSSSSSTHGKHRQSENTIHEKKVRQLLKKGQHAHQESFGSTASATSSVWQSLTNAIESLRDRHASYFNDTRRVHIDTETNDESMRGSTASVTSPTVQDLRTQSGAVIKPRRPSNNTRSRSGGGGGGNGTEYLARVAKSLPFLKSTSFKNGTATQINPVSSSMREYYRDDQLVEMEDECWRRYKVSIFLADTFAADASEQLLLAPAAAAGRGGSNDSSDAKKAAATDRRGTTSSSPPDDVTALVQTTSVHAARKTLCGATFFGDTNSAGGGGTGGRPSSSLGTSSGGSGGGGARRSGNHNSVTSDGMRFLANYETRIVGGGDGGSHLHRRGSSSGGVGMIGSPRTTSMRGRHNPLESSHRGSTTLGRNSISLAAPGAKSVISDGARKRRKRVLKRSQSLPIFDRQFTFMIQEELKESNSKDQTATKLDLGFELLQRCRQPEFTFLFRLYDAWHSKKRTFKNQKVFASTPAVTGFKGPHAAALAKAHGPLVSPRSPFDNGNSSSCNSASSNKAEDFLKLLSRCYRLWECAVVGVAMFYAVSIPYLLCFASEVETLETNDDDHSSDNARLYNYLWFVSTIDLFCIVDLVLKHTTFEGVLKIISGGEDMVSSGHGHGRRRWLSTELMLEVFAALPLDFLLFLPAAPIVTLCRHRWFYTAVFQLNKISRIYEAIEASERLAQFLSTDLNLPLDDSSLRFLRSIGGYVLAGHWIGCVWYITSLHALNVYHYSWLVTDKMLAVDKFYSLESISQWRRYLRSLHFAAGSISTVFYGDLASLNVVETIVEIGVILASILIYGTLVGAHGERIQAHYKRRMMFEQNLTELYYFLQSNEVPRDIRQRLRLYYKNTWLKYHGHEDFEGIHGLSTLLIEDIAQYTLRTFASRVSILQSCDECFLRSLLTCLKHIICSPDEAVVRKGDVDRSMYFIARGKILVKGAGFELVKDVGDFFGELSLLYGIPRSASCLSLGVSLLYVLEWETYEKLLVDFPEYREQNRREWVIVSTVLKKGESRFRSIINIVAKMEKTNWVRIDEIIRKAKSLK